MNNVSFRGNIEIRKFTNGVMSDCIDIVTSPAQDRKYYRDLYDRFGEIPVLGKTGKTNEVMDYLRKFVEDVTGKKLPKIESKEKEFFIGPVSTTFREGVAKDKGQRDAYSVVIHPSRFCMFG